MFVEGVLMKNSISFRRHVKVRGTGHQSYIYSLLRTTDVKPGTLGVSLVQVRCCLTGLQPEKWKSTLHCMCQCGAFRVSFKRNNSFWHCVHCAHPFPKKPLRDDTIYLFHPFQGDWGITSDWILIRYNSQSERIPESWACGVVGISPGYLLLVHVW